MRRPQSARSLAGTLEDSPQVHRVQAAQSSLFCDVALCHRPFIDDPEIKDVLCNRQPLLGGEERSLQADAKVCRFGDFLGERHQVVEVQELCPPIRDLDVDPFLDEAVCLLHCRVGVVHPGQAGEDASKWLDKFKIEVDGLGETMVYPAHH